MFPTIAKKLKLRKQQTATKYLCGMMNSSSTILISRKTWEKKLMNLWEVKNIYETLTRVNCRKDGKCYEEDEENVETLRIAFLENHPIGWAGFDTT